ncbi:MAG: hypothetical protein IKU25_07730 [Clostridia bacterium]|nr:hypothetical protein [Clostridia bacterium]
MKRILTIILALVTLVSVFLLGGCGEQNNVDFELQYDSNDAANMFLCDEDGVMATRFIKTYAEYQAFVEECNQWCETNGVEISGLDEALEKYGRSFFWDNVLIVLAKKHDKRSISHEIDEVFCRIDGKMIVQVQENIDECARTENPSISVFFIPYDDDEITDETQLIIDYNRVGGTMDYKPVIYLYPEAETDVCVKLGYKENITVSYPEYVDGWNVTAKPDGKLVYNETGRNLYSLYYESKNVFDYNVESDGFVVEKENLIEFLEEKLAILGLNEYEAEEFIIYWLPVLQESEYNYIRFATADEIERNMPLEIYPAPDTVIRVLMTFKGLDAPIEVEEQQLQPQTREGFVAVEWGGSVIL